MNYRTGCNKCSDVKTNINEERGKFICLVLAIIVFSGLTGIMMDLIVVMLKETPGKNSVWTIIFSVVVMIVFVMIWIRFMYVWVMTYFVGTNYNIEGYEGES